MIPRLKELYSKEIRVELKKKFNFKKGEKIQTEISKKFTISKFSKLAKSSGWHVKKHWKDAKRYYAVFLLQA